MHRLPFLLAALCVLAAGGCRMHKGGPVPEDLVKSRELSQRGMRAAVDEEWDRAGLLLAEAVKTCPEDADARRQYALSLSRAGRSADAVGQLEEAVRLNPAQADWHVDLGRMYADAGQLDAAWRSVERALDLNPRLPQAWAERARQCDLLGRPQEALALCHRSLSYDRTQRDVLHRLADLYERMGQPRRALSTLEALRATWSAGQEPVELETRMAAACGKLGRWDTAAACLDRACSRRPDDQGLWQALADAQLKAGRPGDAAQSDQRARLAASARPAREAPSDRLDVARLVPVGPRL
jgi:tetratricopeptide (TPR) repeat protein